MSGERDRQARSLNLIKALGEGICSGGVSDVDLIDRSRAIVSKVLFKDVEQHPELDGVLGGKKHGYFKREIGDFPSIVAGSDNRWPARIKEEIRTGGQGRPRDSIKVDEMIVVSDFDTAEVTVGSPHILKDDLA